MKIPIFIRDFRVDYSHEENNRINAEIDVFILKQNEQKGDTRKIRIEQRGGNPKYINLDDKCGRKGERIVADFLHRYLGFPKIDIDLDIRVGATTGWLIDLPGLHVKTTHPVTLKKCLDFSWTFQFANLNGKGGKDAIFIAPDDELVAFAYTQVLSWNYGFVKAILPWGFLKTIIRDPVDPRKVGFVKCVYYKDFAKYAAWEAARVNP